LLRDDIVASFFCFNRTKLVLRTETGAFEKIAQSFFHLFLRLEPVLVTEVLADKPIRNGIDRRLIACTRSKLLRNPFALGLFVFGQFLDGQLALGAEFTHKDTPQLSREYIAVKPNPTLPEFSSAISRVINTEVAPGIRLTQSDVAQSALTLRPLPQSGRGYSD
jgi:hypothetical protein